MPHAGATWSLLLRLLLPCQLYRLLRCTFPTWLALRSMCDESVPAELESLLVFRTSCQADLFSFFMGTVY